MQKAYIKVNEVGATAAAGLKHEIFAKLFFISIVVLLCYDSGINMSLLTAIPYPEADFNSRTKWCNLFHGTFQELRYNFIRFVIT